MTFKLRARSFAIVQDDKEVDSHYQGFLIFANSPPTVILSEAELQPLSITFPARPSTPTVILSEAELQPLSITFPVRPSTPTVILSEVEGS